MVRFAEPKSVTGHTNPPQVVRARWRWNLLVFSVAVLALAFRWYGIHWDQGYLLHPDERFLVMVAVDRIHAPAWQDIATVLDPARSPWNPRSVGLDGRPQAFAYGTLPLTVVELISWVIDRLHGLVKSAAQPPPNPYQVVAFRGRLLTALVDVIGIVFAMAIGRRLGGPVAGLVTGLLLALSVVAIQQAHFFVVDPWATAFAVISLWAALRVALQPSRGNAAIAGIAFAAAVACKVSLWPLIVPLSLALAWNALTSTDSLSPRSLLTSVVSLGKWVAFAALIAYACFEPYTVLQPSATLRDVLREWQIAQGTLDVPYTRQFVDTIPVVYQIVQLVRWGLGPGFALIGCLVVIVELARLGHALSATWRSKTVRLSLRFDEPACGRLLLVSWILAYVVTAWTAETKYLRYTLPVVPALAILTAATLVTRLYRSRSRFQVLAAGGALAIVVLSTLLWALAFSTIYQRPHTRVLASQWIMTNVPAGATLGVEHWDDRLPLPLPGYENVDQRYRFVSLNWYDDRSPEEQFAAVVDALEKTDYIVLSSDRLAGSIPKLPWRYPVIAEFYRLLESGDLGFRSVYTGALESQLGPLHLQDYLADESFTVDDHPSVRIYQKVESLDEATLRERFAWALAQPWYPQRTRPEAYRELAGVPAEAVPVADDLGWSAAWTRHDGLALLGWVLLLVTISLSGLPLAVRVAGELPDAGVGLARVLGLLVSAYLVWLGASWRVVPFEMPFVLLVTIIVGFGTWRLGFRALRAKSWRPHLVAAALSELSFWVAFAWFLFLRWRLPDLWHPYFGGEKPMELAYIDAVARSRWMPPYDPWFSDGTLNYYYYGFFLSAFLWKISGILPEQAFQLTLATLAGLVASVVFSLGSGLASWARGRLVGTEERRQTMRSLDVWTVAGGIGAVWWVLFAGNLDPLLQVITKHDLSIDFWQSSRAIQFAITEFPYFSFLYADLHPHMIALPFWLTVIALGLVIVKRRSDPLAERLLRWLAAILAGATAVVINSWDLPLVLVLVVLLSFLTIWPRRPRQILLAIVLLLPGLVAVRWLYAPFYDRFVSPVTAVQPNRVGSPPEQVLLHFGLLLGLASLHFVTRSRWPAREAWLAGLAVGWSSVSGFAAAVLLSRFSEWSPGPRSLEPWIVLIAALVVVTASCVLDDLRLRLHRAELLLALVVTAFAVGALAAWHPSAGIIVVLAMYAVVQVIADRWSARSLAFGAWLLGLAPLLGAELFVIVDDLYGSPWERMNTVFKLTFEAWPLLAVSGWLIALLSLRALREAPRTGWTFPTVVACLVLLWSCSVLYPLLGTPARLALRLPSSPIASLDGYAWMIGGQFRNSVGETIDTTEDRQVIEWLRQHAQGNPVIAEASIGPYRGNGSRISSATGLPTILGWDRHQRQQRTIILLDDGTVRSTSPLGDAVDRRLLDLRTLYDSTDPAVKRAILLRYRVRYVIVGAVERGWRLPPGVAGATLPDERYASPAGLAAFTQLEGSTVRVAATFGSTIIYEVLPAVTSSSHGA